MTKGLQNLSYFITLYMYNILYYFILFYYNIRNRWKQIQNCKRDRWKQIQIPNFITRILPTSRELARFELTTKAPLIQSFSEMIQEAMAIRCFRKKDSFSNSPG